MKRTMRYWLPLAAVAVGACILLAAVTLGSHPNEGEGDHSIPEERDPTIAGMIEEIDASEIYSTVYALQNFTSRQVGQLGNAEAAEYLFDRLSSMPGMEVEYQGGDLRNVIATLPGADNSSSGIYVVGAHYDSFNDEGPEYAPGATDDGAGVAMVLELARVMSHYRFDHTVMFALWNGEERSSDVKGSALFAEQADANNVDIKLYMNLDATSYDPENTNILYILTNARSQWVTGLMEQNNELYAVGLDVRQSNQTSAWSDHRPFWDHGYQAVVTHSSVVGTPGHTSNDTVDKVSIPWATRDAKLCLSVLADLVGIV
jgi:hypothetical protein